MATKKGPAVEDEDLKDVVAWVEDSFEELHADTQDNIQTYQIAISYAAPTRPREGMVAYADGTKWNPGYGAGAYFYSLLGTWLPMWRSREFLLAARTYYVRTDGNDSNNGLTNSAGGAFLTWQKACDVVSNTLEFNGNSVTIQNGNSGAYTVGMGISPWFGGGSLTIDGNGGSITYNNSGGIRTSGAFSGPLTVKGFTLSTSVNGTAIGHGAAGQLIIGTGMNFGTAAGGDQITCQGPGSVISCNSSYTVSGGARMHMYAALGGVIDMYFGGSGVVTTISANIAYSLAFAYCESGGNIQQITGLRTFALGAFTVTGTRYGVNGGCAISTQGGGPNYFPGTVAGGGAGSYS